ncbi:MAG: hypothetical protein ABH840_01200, partial [Nanoarchaeota archaeon]
MGNKKYLLFLGLVLFLVSFVSAEDSCLSDNLCSLCGDTPRLETPKSFTLKVWDNKKCIGGSDSYLNGEYELTQSSFNSCVWEHNGVGDVYTVYVWGGTDNSLSAIFYTDYGDTAYFNFDISGSCTETMEADFDSSFLCDNDNFNVVPIHNSDNVKGGHATLTSCPMSKPKIEIDFKDKYKLDTMKNRYFTPKKPVTPYDDITCKVTVDIPAGLTEEEDTQFTTDTINRFEKAKADLIVVDEDGNDFGKIVSTTKLEFSLKESVVGKKIVFVWDIPGWKQGWTFDQDMINRIVNKRKIDCVVVVGGITYNLDKPEPTSNCVLIAGP